MELKYWLNSINLTKENILDEDPSEKYPAFVVNRCLSYFVDTIAIVNEMNKRPLLQNKLQFDFLLNIVRSRKRFKIRPYSFMDWRTPEVDYMLFPSIY